MANDKQGSNNNVSSVGDDSADPGGVISATPGFGAVPADNTIQSRHLNPISLWAAGIKTPLHFDDHDARLPNPADGDQPFGQGSWKVGLDFKDFAHLGDLLGGGQFALPSFVCNNSFQDCGPIEENQITRLAILAHGGPGGVDIDAKAGRNMDQGASADPDMLNAGTLSKYSKQFDQILKALAFRARVFFMCCLTGAEKEGDNFLLAVSNLWAAKEIFVIGYKSVLFAGPQGKPGSGGASCFPGVRETHYSNNKVPGGPQRYYETATAWNDLNLLPWATALTPHATQAFRGVLLKTGKDANPWGAAPP